MALVAVRSARGGRVLLALGGFWWCCQGEGDAQTLEVNPGGLDLNPVAQLEAPACPAIAEFG